MLFLKKSSVSWIVVFLGNPGAKYNGTRHNAGFMTAQEAEKKFSARIDRLKFKALTGTCEIGGEKVFLMKPQTYMNLSGEAVRPAMQFYKVPLDRVLVISDDISMPTGKLRIRRSGSSGGHNGLKNISALCGGDDFPRIKIGVGVPPHPDYDTVDWVLGVFRNQDAVDMAEATKRACDAIETVIKEGLEKAMAKFN